MASILCVDQYPNPFSLTTPTLLSSLRPLLPAALIAATRPATSPVCYFLVERGALHLLHGNDVILSLNDIYKKISEGKGGCSWECFVVYRNLKSLGYIVRRHGLPWAFKNREMVEDVQITELVNDMQVNELKLEFDVFLPNSKFKKSSPGNPYFVLSLVSDKPPSRREVENLEKQCNGIPLKFCNVDHGRVSFFSFDKIELPVLP